MAPDCAIRCESRNAESVYSCRGKSFFIVEYIQRKGTAIVYTCGRAGKAAHRLFAYTAGPGNLNNYYAYIVVSSDSYTEIVYIDVQP